MEFKIYLVEVSFNGFINSFQTMDYPQDSIQLMKKIMDVQDELDRFRVSFFFSI